MPDLHQDVIKAYVIVLYIGSCKRLPELLFVCLQRKINISLLQYGWVDCIIFYYIFWCMKYW